MTTLVPFRPTGLSRDLYLPSELDVQNRIVSHPNVRSYQAYTSQSKTTVHDTGNDDTDVIGEYDWLAGGRKGGSAGGYNDITDSFRIWFTVPHDEVTWHAGTTLGNRSWGTEWAYGRDKRSGRFDQSFEVNMRLHAAKCEAMGWKPDVAAVLHEFWYGKYCSRQILSRGLWDEAEAMMTQFYTEARTARTGKPVTSPITYVTPQRIKVLDDALSTNLDPNQPALTVAPRSVYDPKSDVRFVWVGDRVRAIDSVDRDQYAYDGSPDVGPAILKGTEFDVDWWFIAGDGREWYLTPWLTRVLAEKTIRINDAKAAA